MGEEGNRTSLIFFFPLPVKRCAEAASLRGSCCGVSGAPGEQLPAPVTFTCSSSRQQRPGAAAFHPSCHLSSLRPRWLWCLLMEKWQQLLPRHRLESRSIGLFWFLLLIILSPFLSPHRNQAMCCKGQPYVFNSPKKKSSWQEEAFSARERSAGYWFESKPWCLDLYVTLRIDMVAAWGTKDIWMGLALAQVPLLTDLTAGWPTALCLTSKLLSDKHIFLPIHFRLEPFSIMLIINKNWFILTG